jgi:MinD-like ATPase involved in chromosome partitioning or flagellar assembly
MAINLATIFSRDDKNAILLELRPSGGSLATMLNLNSVLTIDTLSELGGPHVLDSSTGRTSFGPRLLAAPAGLPDGKRWEPLDVETLVDRAASTAAFVIVDATPLLPELLKAAVSRAWFTLLVLEREPASIQMAARITGALTGWSSRLNSVGAALVNHMPFMDAAPIPAVRAEINCGIVGVLPPGREVLQSYRRQGPIVLAQPAAPISIAYEEIATRVDHDPIQFVA